MIKTVAFTVALALSGTAMAATNLVANVDFELGNTGFTSNYAYVDTPGPTAMYGEGTYTVGGNSADYHNLWASVGAQEGDLYLIANGSPSNDAPVWKQTLTGLTAGHSYKFTAFGVNVCCNANFSGNNVSPILITVGSSGSPSQIATTGTLGDTGDWTKFTGTFVASGTSTELSIFTDPNALSGNDFGLDTISVAAVPEPAQWALMFGGFGLLGGAMRRRRRANVVFA